MQAMMIATVMELLGALTLGANNANTIRGSIIATVSEDSATRHGK